MFYSAFGIAIILYKFILKKYLGYTKIIYFQNKAILY